MAVKTIRDVFKFNNGGVIAIVGAGGKTSLMFRLAEEFSNAGETVLTTTTTKILVPETAQSKDVIVSENLDDLNAQATEIIKKTYLWKTPSGCAPREKQKSLGTPIYQGKIPSVIIEHHTPLILMCFQMHLMAFMDTLKHPGTRQKIKQTLWLNLAIPLRCQPGINMVFLVLQVYDTE